MSTSTTTKFSAFKKSPQHTIKVKLAKAKKNYDPDDEDFLDCFHDVEKIKKNFFEEIENQKSEFKGDKNFKIKIKFVLGKFEISEFVQKITPNFMIPFGFAHSGLLIGPWYLNWDENSLCDPFISLMSKKRKF